MFNFISEGEKNVETVLVACQENYISTIGISILYFMKK